MIDDTDCDDTRASVHPGALEACDGLDDDCDGQIDEDVLIAFYPDSDGDGYGQPGSSLEDCAAPAGYVPDAGDCDDTAASIHPGAEELCNALDDDCDGALDDGLSTTPWYPDADRDGHGAATDPIAACGQPEGYSSSSDDCDDALAAVYPGATEVCDGIDDDCDGDVDEALTALFYLDADLDGHGTEEATARACALPEGYATVADDCDDDDPEVYPGAYDLVGDGVDGGCDGAIDLLDSVVAPYVIGDGGYATNASLASPYSVTMDAQGLMFIVEANRVRKVDSSGVISTYAGGSSGYAGDNGPASDARFSSPREILQDGRGGLLIADAGNARIRRIDASGIVTTIAGTGTAGYSGDGGKATAAQLNGPVGIGLDSSGNLYIADTNNHRVRKVGADGVITTVAGKGTAGYSGDGGSALAAQLNLPRDVKIDSKGNLFIADANNARVRKVSGGIITTAVGTGTFGYSGDGGPATSAQIYGVCGLWIDLKGQLFLVDFNTRVRMVDTSGIIRTVAGNGTLGYSGDGGPATKAMIRQPSNITVNATGDLLIADNVNGRIRRVDSSGIITTIAGNPSYVGENDAALHAKVNEPYGVFMDRAGTLYIADTSNHRVRKVSPAGIISTVAGTGTAGFTGDGGPATAASINAPQGVFVDAAGVIYIADSNNSRIRRIDAAGTISTVAGSSNYGGYGGDNGPATAAKLNVPGAVAVDALGSIHIADTNNNRVRKVGKDGIIRTVAGTGFNGYGADNVPASTSYVAYPYGVTLDEVGNLFIADTAANRIRKVDSSGIITTVAGTGTLGYNGDGIAATKAWLRNPSTVVVDPQGNLFIADQINHRIRRVDTAGIITTVAGTGTYGFSGDGGDATGGMLNFPHGLAIDAGGALYIADTQNDAVRWVMP